MAFSVSVVIPAYNEKNRLRNCVDTVENYFLKDYSSDFEIIIIDDGSNDETSEITNNLKSKYNNVFSLRNEKNLGKGYSIKRGMLAAKGDIVIFTDTDMAVPIEEFRKFSKAIESGFDIAIASRRLKDSQIKVYQPLFRRVLSWFFHIIRRLLYLWDIKDTQCGFKCFRKEVIKPVFEKQTVNGFVFDVEILVIARLMNLKIAEIPVVWSDDTRSTLLPIRHMKEIGLNLFKIRFNIIKGRYK